MRNLRQLLGIVLCLCVPSAFGLIVSEFVQDVCDGLPDSGTESAQFIVVYHAGPGVVDLNGWTIGHLASSSTSTITNSLLLQPGDRVVFGEMTAPFFEAEYGFFPTDVPYRRINLPDFEAVDGIVFERDATTAACNSGAPFSSPAANGELAVWNSVTESWGSAGLLSRSCNLALIPEPVEVVNFGEALPICPPSGPCEITAIQVVEAACSTSPMTPDQYDVLVLVSYTNAPTDGILIVNGVSGRISENPQPVLIKVDPTNSYTLTASFESSSCVRSRTLDEDISAACICSIDRIELVSTSACFSNGSGDGYVDITLDVYATNPRTDELTVQTRSEGKRVVYSGSPTRVTLSALANGLPVDVRATSVGQIGIRPCFLDTSFQIPACPMACRVTGVDLLGVGPCDGSGIVQVDLEVRSENPNAVRPSVSFLEGSADMVSTFTTGSVSQVSFPAVADGRPLDLRVFLQPDCFLETNLNVNLPDCPGTCALSNLSVVSISPCPENGTLEQVEVVTMVEFEPSLFTELVVGGEIHPVTSSPMLFTNSYPANGSVVTISADWVPSSFNSPMGNLLQEDLVNRCPGLSIDIALPLSSCACVITNASAVLAGPCRTDGRRLVEITVEYAGFDPDWELFFPGAAKSFPLTGSPQTERVLLYNLRSAPVEILEPIPIVEPYPFGPSTSNRVVCSRTLPINASQCPRELCAIQDVQVVGMTCLQGGVVAVDVAITHTNVSPLHLMDVNFNGVTKFIEPKASPQVDTFFLLGDGSEFSFELTLLDRTSMFITTECTTNAVNLATLPECSSPCQLTRFEPVSVGLCSDGMVDVTFEIAATGATGTYFGVELQDRSISDFFLYTNTPMQAVLRVPANGSAISVVAGQIIPTNFRFSDYNPNCAVLVPDILAVPDCGAASPPPPRPQIIPDCEFVDVQVVGMDCLEGGGVAVDVVITYTNLAPFTLVAAEFGGISTSFRVDSPPQLETFFLFGDGSEFSLQLTVEDAFGVACTTNAVNLATLPVCEAPCRLTRFEPVSIGACSDGLVDVTFEIAATDADGTFFRVELPNQGVNKFFTYTNTPMQVVLRVPVDGSSVRVLAGQVFRTDAISFNGFNPTCALGAIDMLTLPDCASTATTSCSTGALSFTATVTLPPPIPTIPLTDLPGFYTMSNTVTILQTVPDPGRIRTATGQILVELCPDEIAVPITVLSDLGTGVMPMAYVITDEADQVLMVSTSDLINPSALPLGTSRIYGVVFTGELADLAGTSIDSLSPFPCGRSENFITVDRSRCPSRISGVIWNDLNNDGTPFSENLGIFGFQNIAVRILEVSGVTPVVVAVVTTGPGGVYTSPELAPGTYEVFIEPEDFLDVQFDRIATTPLSYQLTLGDDSSTDINFGFSPPPLVAELESFTATMSAGGVSLSWIIGAELDHLGYKVYRSATADGIKVSVDDRLILADGSHGYSSFDPNGDAGSFYWLESISNNLETEFFGPFQVPRTSVEVVEDLQLVIVHHVPFIVHARTHRMLVKGLPEDATLVIPDSAEHASLEGESEPGEYILKLRVDDQVRGE